MSFILVIGGAPTPRQGYEQCEGGQPHPPLSGRHRNTFQMNDEISQNKALNIFFFFLFQCLPFTFYYLFTFVIIIHILFIYSLIFILLNKNNYYYYYMVPCMV